MKEVCEKHGALFVLDEVRFTHTPAAHPSASDALRHTRILTRPMLMG